AGQLLLHARGETNGPDVPDSMLIALGTVETAAVGRPRIDEIRRMVGEDILNNAGCRIHQDEVAIVAALPSRRKHLTVRRPHWKSDSFLIECELFHLLSGHVHQPQILHAVHTGVESHSRTVWRKLWPASALA